MSDTALRASDDDRERVAERLRTGHTEGRLDLDELQERLERTYAAKTLGELPRSSATCRGRTRAAGRPACGRWCRSWSWRS